MSGKATFLYLKQTGHLLAALSRVASPDAKESVDSFVATDLTVRGLPAFDSLPATDPKEFHVAAEYLAVGVTDLRPALLASPRLFTVEDPTKDPPNVVGPNDPASTTPPFVDPGASTLTTTKLTIALKTPLPAGLDQPVSFWAQIEGVDSLIRPAIQVVKGQIPKNVVAKDFDLSDPLVAGTKYLVIIGVAGMPLFVKQFNPM